VGTKTTPKPGQESGPIGLLTSHVQLPCRVPRLPIMRSEIRPTEVQEELDAACNSDPKTVSTDFCSFMALHSAPLNWRRP
jgi:hypothetical protein